MSVANETGEALFICFDGIMTKLHNMRAYEAGHLLAGDGVNAEETHAPPFVISHGRQDLHVLDEGELRQIFSKSSDP